MLLGGHHVISRVETVMSDGTVQISSSLPPELAHMISNVPHSLVPVQDTEQVIFFCALEVAVDSFLWFLC